MEIDRLRHIAPHRALRRAEPCICWSLIALIVTASCLWLPGSALAEDTLTIPVTINKLASFDLSAQRATGEQFTGIDAMSSGAASIESDGTGSFMPRANFVGTETIRAWLESSEAPARAISVTFDVTGTATGTETRGDFVETSEDNAVVIYPTSNDAPGPGGVSLTILLENEPVHGSAEVRSDGSILYTPDPDWNGREEFSYVASDGVSTKSAPIGINILSVRDVPTATADAIVVRQGEQASIDVLVNDFDGDGDQFRLAGFTQPQFGSISWSDGDHMFWYQPNAEFHGEDHITYTLADADGQGTSIVTITVDGAPTPTDDSLRIEVGGSITFDPRENDSDPEGSALVVTSVTKPAHGRASIKADGTVTYKADDSNSTDDSFTYTVQDAIGNSAMANVLITRAAEQTSVPIAVTDEFLVLEESAGNTLDLLGNDSFPAGSVVAVTIVTSPSNGTLVVDAMQQVTYVPNLEYSGPDLFTYRISGSTGTSETQVNITVQPQNDLPMAGPESAATDEDTPVKIDVLANDTDIDGDDLIVESVTNGALGNAEVANDGTIQFTPNPDRNGTDQISYVLSDGAGGTAMMMVPITINPVADAPHGVTDSAQTDPGASIEIDVLANDRDPDGDPLLNLRIVDQPSHGTASVHANARISYQSQKSYKGKDTFIYSVSDPAGQSVEVTVNVQIGEPNGKPEAQPDMATVIAGKAVRVDVLINDGDPDKDDLSLQSVGDPEHGTAEIRGNEIRYEPEPGFVGTDTFTYRINDGDQTDTGRVTITVIEPDE